MTYRNVCGQASNSEPDIRFPTIFQREQEIYQLTGTNESDNSSMPNNSFSQNIQHDACREKRQEGQ